MPTTFTKMASNKATVTFQYGEDQITVAYLPSKVTEKVFALLAIFDSAIANLDATNYGKAFQALNEALIELIASWDVYEDDAQTVMYPVDVEHLPNLPIAFRVTTLRSITRDMRPEARATQS